MRFVLIHGGFHGAWCWDHLIPELERLGHEAIAIDLPGHGTRRDERSNLADRRDAIVAVMKPGDVLMGHSGGGFDITLAADAAPEKVGHLIYLAAGVPVEGRTILEVIGGQKDAGGGRLTSEKTGMHQFTRMNAKGRMECIDFAAVRDFFYHDVDETLARWAFDRLTPAPFDFLVETVHLPNFWKADLPRSYILCLQDRGGGRFLHRTFADQLGVAPLTIDSSHSPFLSKPRELADLMVKATTTRPIGPLQPIRD
jgi:pimeloyl-ACP methyl ester carboxylesterase